MLTAITRKSQWFNKTKTYFMLKSQFTAGYWGGELCWCALLSHWESLLPSCGATIFFIWFPRYWKGWEYMKVLMVHSIRQNRHVDPTYLPVAEKGMFPGREEKHTYWYSLTRGIANKWLIVGRRQSIVPCTLPAQGLFSLNHLSLWSNLTKTHSKGGFHISSWQRVI